MTGEARYRQVVDETIGYVLRDLRHPDGGFYSAEDADSEGEEGRFYVWTPGAARRGARAGARAGRGDRLVRRHRGRQLRGRHHPAPPGARRPAAAAGGRAGPGRCCSRPATQRVRPGLDDKVLTEWNGLMLAALAEAGAALERRGLAGRGASPTREFLLADLRRDDGRWLRSWQADGGARHLALAADYAALVDAFTALAEATGEARWIDEARAVADALLDLFWDVETAGCSPPPTTPRR